MRIRWFTSLLLTVLMIAARHAGTVAQAAESGQLLVGWAQASILPDRPVAIGGQYETRISDVVHDPLTVTALALESRTEQRSIDKIIWVSCDLAGIRQQQVERARALISQQLPDFPSANLIVSATHTHTAPSLTDTEETDLHPYDFAGSWAYRLPVGDTRVMRPREFADLLEHRIADAVIAAWKSRTPAEFSFAQSHASVARNRRAVFYDGTTRLYGDTRDPLFSHTEGTTDDSVDCLFFWRDNQLTGIAITLYCPSQEVEGETYLSADFWHDARQALRDRFGETLFVLPLTGASGDQSPHIQVARDAESRTLKHFRLSYREEIARRLVQSVDHVVEVARSTRAGQVILQHHVERVPLPVWKVSDQRFADASANVTQGANRLHELSAPEYIRWRVDRTMTARYAYQKQDPYYQAEVHGVRLDDLALVTNPFELFTDYSQRIKARSPATQTAVVQLTSDCGGYLPTERAVVGGGYSARIDDGVVGPEGGRAYVEAAVQLLQSLWTTP